MITKKSNILDIGNFAIIELQFVYLNFWQRNSYYLFFVRPQRVNYTCDYQNLISALSDKLSVIIVFRNLTFFRKTFLNTTKIKCRKWPRWTNFLAFWPGRTNSAPVAMYPFMDTLLGCPGVLSNGHYLRGIGPISFIFWYVM